MDFDRTANNGVPMVDVTFPDGHQDKMVLHHFSPDNKDDCNFLGHLEKDAESSLAMTGCPGIDDLEFTINSKHSGPSNMFVLKKSGDVEAVPPPDFDVVSPIWQLCCYAENSASGGALPIATRCTSYI